MYTGRIHVFQWIRMLISSYSDLEPVLITVDRSVSTGTRGRTQKDFTENWLTKWSTYRDVIRVWPQKVGSEGTRVDAILATAIKTSHFVPKPLYSFCTWILPPSRLLAPLWKGLGLSWLDWSFCVTTWGFPGSQTWPDIQWQPHH